MKKLKLSAALISLLMFQNLVLAINPNANVDNIAAKMVSILSKDIVLTDSQKTVIQQNAKTFILRFNEASASKTGNEKLATMNFSKEYKIALDGILTLEQKEQLILKRNERKQILTNKYKTK